jgi:hypothetical protein
MTDGEATERIWSQLSGHARTTKEMLKGNRRDLLEDALLFIWMNSTFSAMKTLRARQVRTDRAIELHMNTIVDLTQEQFQILRLENQKRCSRAASTSKEENMNRQIRSMVCTISDLYRNTTSAHELPSGVRSILSVSNQLQVYTAKLYKVYFLCI